MSSSVQCSLPLPVRLHFEMWWLLKVNRPEICCMCSTCTSACGKQSLTIAGWLKTFQLAAHWSPSHKKEQERQSVAYIIVRRFLVTTVKLPTSRICLCTASHQFPIVTFWHERPTKPFSLALHEQPCLSAYYLVLLIESMLITIIYLICWIHLASDCLLIVCNQTTK